jgi:Tol biopolymer transport system component
MTPSNLQIHFTPHPQKEELAMSYHNLTTHPGVPKSARTPLAATISVFLLAAVLTGGGIASAQGTIPSQQIYGQNILPGVIANYNPMWSPDGQWIAVATILKGLVIVPSAGGDYRTPVSLTRDYTYQDRVVKIKESVIGVGGFSADGRYVYITRSLFDEARDSIYFHDGGYGYHTSVMELERVDMNTGEIEVIADGVSVCKLSRSGRYLAYNLFGDLSGIMMKDLETGDTWKFSCSIDLCFTPDDRYIIFNSGDRRELYQMPIEGGTPVQLTSGNNGFLRYTAPEVSPDGKWLLYHYSDLTNTPPVTVTITDPDTSFVTYGWCPNTIIALNRETGEKFPLFPSDYMYGPSEARFSPDGKKISYILYSDTSDGNTWEVWVRDFTPGSLYTNGQTAVAEALPSGFSISGNYPNPFNPSTTISFSLPVTGTVSLAVYDITGRKVRDLVNGSLTRGAHSAVWNGLDSEGRAVSTGVYLSRLTMNGKSATNRMLLAK